MYIYRIKFSWFTTTITICSITSILIQRWLNFLSFGLIFMTCYTCIYIYIYTSTICMSSIPAMHQRRKCIHFLVCDIWSTRMVVRKWERLQLHWANFYRMAYILESFCCSKANNMKYMYIPSHVNALLFSMYIWSTCTCTFTMYTHVYLYYLSCSLFLLACQSVYLPAWLPICLFDFMFVYFSFCQSTPAITCLLISLFVCIYVC